MAGGLGDHLTLGRTNAVAHACPCLSCCCLLQGSTLRLTISLDLVLVSTYNTTFGASTIQGVSNYAVSGQLVAEVGLRVWLCYTALSCAELSIFLWYKAVGAVLSSPS